MSNQQLLTADQQRDLGIITMQKKQTEISCKTANIVEGFIALNFKCKTNEMILPQYKSLVCPHLECAVQFWFPDIRQNIDKV